MLHLAQIKGGDSPCQVYNHQREGGAKSGMSEVDHWLMASRDLQLITVEGHETLSAQVGEVNALLHALRARLRATPPGEYRRTV